MITANAKQRMGVMNGCCLWMRGMKKKEGEGKKLGRRPWLLLSPLLCLPRLLALAGIDMRSALSLGL